MAVKAAVRAARSSARQACVAPVELHQLLDSLSNDVLTRSAFFDHEQQQQALHAEGLTEVHATAAAAAAAQAPAVSQLQHHTLSKQQQQQQQVQQQHTFSTQQQQNSWYPHEQLKQRMYTTPTCMGPLQQQQHSRFSESSMHSASSSQDSSKGSSTDSSSTSGPSASSGSSSSSAAGASAASAPADFLAAALLAMGSSSKAAQLTPAAITQQLDKHIVGQAAAKRAVAVALRNRWRRHRLPSEIAEEITPKNILMIGPTGCGKTEIARRLAKLVEAPFVKVEATKFTELGFVGRDVDEIVKDLMEAALALTKQRLAAGLRAAAGAAVERLLLQALLGGAEPSTYDAFRPMYQSGELDDNMVELDLDALADITAAAAAAAAGSSSSSSSSSNGGPAAAGHAALGSLASTIMEAMSRHGAGGPGGLQGRGKRRMKVREARRLLLDAEVERALASERVTREALRAAQQDGIVFIDEIDKIVDTSRGAAGSTSSNVSSEGVQRDLLPILEGSTVATKYGNVSTDHVLFIASGAFHSSKPGDMLAELQGRLPVRVELAGLTADDFYRILTEPQHNMLRQQAVLMATEGIDLHFTDGAVRSIAKAAEDANRLLDNIGARRLHTVLERVLADVSFSADKLVAEAKASKASSSSSSKDAAPGPAASKPSGSKGTRKQKQQGAAAAAAGSGTASGSGESSSSSSSSSSEEADKLTVRYEVTEDMVQACMKELLKHQDLSRYVL
uniref:AAA+ ATPase domain-containing protein n=1 Tax=Tetradesmus obliquus TaxID=3088 RepID=A0A383WBI3_TETOB|eukprot:jgi/Sobl393_1/52/SZX74791.1